MKIRLAILPALVAVLWIATATLLADHSRSRGKGWPNKGISAPGQPNHYASPHGRHGHP